MADRFTCEVRHEGDAGVINLAGDLDGEAATVLADSYADAAESADRIVLNFAPMAFMNSSGIALVVELLGRARADGRSVHAVGLSDHYRHIFEITRLSDFMTIHEPAAEGIAQ